MLHLVDDDDDYDDWPSKDGSIFLTQLVIIELRCETEHIQKTIYVNPFVNSAFGCRPVRFAFEPESKENMKEIGPCLA